MFDDSSSAIRWTQTALLPYLHHSDVEEKFSSCRYCRPGTGFVNAVPDAVSLPCEVPVSTCEFSTADEILVGSWQPCVLALLGNR